MAKIWFALVALVLLAAPATAFAESAQPFTASGDICLAELPQMVVGVPYRTGLHLTALGERLAGTISASSGWDDLEGATVNITITRENSFFDFTTGTFSGRINGSLAVTTANGVSTGRLKGTVSGVFTDPDNILASIISSSAQVSWAVTGNSGKAWGDGNATFTPTGLGFCGPLNLAGTVRET